MPLTKISTDGVKDDAITKAKIPANQIEASELANDAVDTNAIQDEAVTLAKLPHGDSNNDGKFLRANDGADPTFETVSTTPEDGSITQAKLNFPVANRNLIINGAFLIAQRSSSDTTSSGYQTVDRFEANQFGVAASPLQRQFDVASGTTPYTLGFRKSYRLQNGNQTQADSDAFIRFKTTLEAQDIANSGWNYVSSSSFITLSFWIKSTVAQNFYGRLQTVDGTSQNYSFETGSLSQDTWTKVTKTIPGNSNLQFDNDNQPGLILEIAAWFGADYTSSGVSLNTWAAYASGTRTPDQTSTWYLTNDAKLEITGVQLEVGNVATDFEHRPFAVEERLCKRYFCKYDSPLNINFVNEHANNKKGYLHFPYEEVMRDTPSVAFSSVNIARPQVSVGISITEAQNIQRRCFNLVGWPSGSTLGSHGDAYYRMTISGGGNITCDAEL